MVIFFFWQSPNNWCKKYLLFARSSQNWLSNGKVLTKESISKNPKPNPTGQKNWPGPCLVLQINQFSSERSKLTEVGFWSIKIESLLLLPSSPQKNRVTDFVVVGEPGTWDFFSAPLLSHRCPPSTQKPVYLFVVLI